MAAVSPSSRLRYHTQAWRSGADGLKVADTRVHAGLSRRCIKYPVKADAACAKIFPELARLLITGSHIKKTWRDLSAPGEDTSAAAIGFRMGRRRGQVSSRACRAGKIDAAFGVESDRGGN